MVEDDVLFPYQIAKIISSFSYDVASKVLRHSEMVWWVESGAQAFARCLRYAYFHMHNSSALCGLLHWRNGTHACFAIEVSWATDANTDRTFISQPGGKTRVEMLSRFSLPAEKTGLCIGDHISHRSKHCSGRQRYVSVFRLHVNRGAREPLQPVEAYVTPELPSTNMCIGQRKAIKCQVPEPLHFS